MKNEDQKTAKPLSERELLRLLGLPQLPDFCRGKSSRFTKWIEYGLPFISKNGSRYFLQKDIETFLEARYGISITQFKLRNNDKSYITVLYVDLEISELETRPPRDGQDSDGTNIPFESDWGFKGQGDA